MSYGHSDDNDFSSPSFKRTLHSRLQHSPSTEEFLQSFSVDPTTLEDFVAWPSDLCTRVDLSDESAKTEYRIFIQARSNNLFSAILVLALSSVRLKSSVC